MSDPADTAQAVELLNGTEGIAARTPPAIPLKITVKRRLERENRWKDIEPTRNDMMSQCRKRGMSKEQAQEWTYAELDRMYPPLPPPEPEPPAPAIVEQQAGQSDESEASTTDEGNVSASADDSDDGEPPSVDATSRPRESGIPPGWPDLPPNASLQAEIAWVQANRLDVVDGDRIRLDRAKEPAPSRAALGWLETSVRSYAKYIEVAAKATAVAQDEQDQVRQERVALEDVRALLGEMV